MSYGSTEKDNKNTYNSKVLLEKQTEFFFKMFSDKLM